MATVKRALIAGVCFTLGLVAFGFVSQAVAEDPCQWILSSPLYGGDPKGLPRDEAAMSALEMAGYFSAHPSQSKEAVEQEIAAVSAAESTIALSTEGDPVVALEEVSEGRWVFGQVSFCTTLVDDKGDNT